MRKKIFISTLAFNNFKLDKIIQILKKNKVDGIDLAPLIIFKSWNNFKNNLNKFRTKLEYNNIEINALQGIFFKKNINLFYSSKKKIANITKHLNKIIKITKYLGAKKIIIGSSYFRCKKKLDIVKADYKFINYFSKFKKVLKKNGIIFCLETIPSQYNEDYIYNISHMTKIIKRINSKNIKINFDTSLYHFKKFNFGEFSKNFTNIANVQISQKNFLNFNKISKNNLKFLKKIKYNKQINSISIEMILKTPTVLEINNSIKNIKQIFG